jgi:hypothetical protein
VATWYSAHTEFWWTKSSLRLRLQSVANSGVVKAVGSLPNLGIHRERIPTMESVLDDCFVVFLRHDRSQSFRPDHAERPLASCSTYEEARRIQRQLQQTYRDCVIRYVGETGGGD